MNKRKGLMMRLRQAFPPAFIGRGSRKKLAEYKAMTDDELEFMVDAHERFSKMSTSELFELLANTETHSKD